MIGQRALLTVQQIADLGPVPLNAAPRPVIKAKLSDRDTNLAGDEFHSLIRDLALSTRKSTVVDHELQQQAEHQRVHPTLATCPLPLFTDQYLISSSRSSPRRIAERNRQPSRAPAAGRPRRDHTGARAGADRVLIDQR